MNADYRDSEKGQAIVYLVLGLVVFLGFVALAIDGGMALADRRHSQNGADAASLAGAGAAALLLEQGPTECYDYWVCDEDAYYMDTAESAAVSRASTNNFSIIIDDLSAHNGVIAQCGEVSYPWGFTDKFIDVTVDISATTQTNFAHLLFPNALHNEVDAITRIHPRQPIGFGNAIVALNPAGCSGGQNGMNVYGTGTTYITGGGIFSNGCLRGNGTFTVVITSALAVGDEIIPGDWDNWDPDPEPITYTIPESNYDIVMPNCSHPDANIVNSLPATMDPGLYCITRPQGLRINNNENITGNGVTIVVTDGPLTINGTPVLHLTAPGDTPDPDPAVPGLLIYLPPTNHNTVTMNGTEDSFFAGMIYAPGANIKLNGTGGNSYLGQIIGWNVEVGGTNDTTVIYDACTGFTRPPSIELSK